MRIVLIGFMGSGKSTVGRKLAHRLNLPFADLDEVVEQQAGQTISKLFAEQGEKHFRELERKALAEQLNADRFILSTGGGTPCYGSNMQLLLNSGLVVYLDLTAAALASRLIGAKSQRPLLSQFSEEELPAEIERLLEKRLPFYNQAQLQVNAMNLKGQELSRLAQVIQIAWEQQLTRQHFDR